MEHSFNLGNLEYLILNYSLKDRPFWLKVFEHIKPVFFEKDENRKIFKTFKKHFEEYGQLPDVEVTKNELRNIEPSTIDGIYNMLAPEDNESKKSYIYDNTLRFIKENMMAEKLKHSIDLMEEGRFDEIGEHIKEVLLFNLDTSLGISIKDVDERYDRINKMMTERIPTGFSVVDSILKGGWAKKELYSVAAPPGVGKCQTYNTEIEIEINENSEAYKILKKYLYDIEQ